MKRCAYVHIHRHSAASMSSIMHNKFYKTSEQSAQAENRARELYTPRRTHVNPAMPAWRRMYWEKVKKCRDARSRSRIVIAVEGKDLSSFSFSHCTYSLRIFFWCQNENQLLAKRKTVNKSRTNFLTAAVLIRYRNTEFTSSVMVFIMQISRAGK